MSNIIVTADPTDTALAQKIASELQADFAALETSIFPNGEFKVQASELLTDKTVILLQQSYFPLNDKIIQLNLALNAIRNRQPRRLILILPYFPYSRQDRLSHPGIAIGAAMMAQFIQLAKPNALFVMDLHSTQIMDYCHFPITNISPAALFAQDIQDNFCLKQVCLVSPDLGSKNRAQEIAQILNVPSLNLIKERLNSGEVKVQISSPLIKKKTYIFIDDIIDTGTTLLSAAALFPLDSQKYVYATHGVLSCPLSFQKLQACFNLITVTHLVNPAAFHGQDFQTPRIICYSAALLTELKSFLSIT